MVPEQVLNRLAEQAPFALILGGAGLLALYALLRYLRSEREATSRERAAAVEERERITQQFLAYIRERSLEDRAVIERNTRVMERVVVALDRSEDRDNEWQEERRHAERRQEGQDARRV